MTEDEAQGQTEREGQDYHGSPQGVAVPCFAEELSPLAEMLRKDVKDDLKPFIEMAQDSARLVAIHSAEVECLKIATVGTRQELTEMKQVMVETRREIQDMTIEIRGDRADVKAMFEQLITNSEPTSPVEATREKWLEERARMS